MQSLSLPLLWEQENQMGLNRIAKISQDYLCLWEIRLLNSGIIHAGFSTVRLLNP